MPCRVLRPLKMADKTIPVPAGPHWAWTENFCLTAVTLALSLIHIYWVAVLPYSRAVSSWAGVTSPPRLWAISWQP